MSSPTSIRRTTSGRREERLEDVACPICRADRAKLWGRAAHGKTIVCCRGCGLRYLSPRLAAARVAAQYTPDYFDRHRARERESGSRDLVRERDQASLELIRRHAPTDRPSLLDVGAGTGSFLKLARDTGGFGDLAGTDITDANAALFAEAGIPLHVGEIEALETGRFDVVSAQHVLEHVPRPDRFLARLRELLTERGIVHLVVPNEGSFTSRVKSGLSRSGVKPRPFKHLAPDHHLWFYEPRTLVRMLEASGFEVLQRRTRAEAKRRGPWQRLVHRAFDVLELNSWLEVIARPAIAADERRPAR